jgi:hypothetical protein
MSAIETIYTRTARFDSAEALNDDQLRALVPSIFANTAHESRSDRFQPIPTIDAVNALREEGFQVVGAKQNRVRSADKRNFTKHLLRFRRIGDDATYRVGDTVTEIYLRNANDGTSQYELMAGLFRIACLNSLVAQTGTLSAVKVRHSGMDVIDRVVNATLEARKVAHLSLDAPARWGAIDLDLDRRVEFAEAARRLRFGVDENNNVLSPISATQLLEARRVQDTKTDLWSVFNVIQEHCIRGGLTAESTRVNRVNGNRRVVTTRQVRAIDAEVKINRDLWELAESFAV